MRKAFFIFSFAGLLAFTGCKDKVEVANVDEIPTAGESTVINPTDFFRFSQKVKLNDSTKQVVVLSFGSESAGNYLILYADSAKNTFFTASGYLEGTIERVRTTDLDEDSLQEVMITARAPTSEKQGKVILHELTENQQFRRIEWPQLSEAIGADYKGRDSLYVEDVRLIREFPLYKEGDPPASPSGGKRRVVYALQNDELVVSESEKIKK